MGVADQGQLGRYQLVRKLATGGMAEVFLAKAVGPGGFEKTLVVKRILPSLSEDPAFVEMFLSEARLAAQLNHPNIAQIFDFGDVEGTWFLAMEYVDGPNLRSVLRAAPGRRMPLALGARLLAQACEGLAYAHEFVDPTTGAPLGLIHRDVSTDNLLVSSAGAVKVVDFGIAKAQGQVSKTETGMVKGKVAYMAPEQLGGNVDLRADVYAVGVILYELAAGGRPYGDLTGVPLMAAVLQTPPPPLRERAPDVPADYAAIVAKAMARAPAERFQSCRDLEAALTDFVQAQRERVGAVQLARYVAEVMGPPSARALTGAAAPGGGTPVSSNLRAATDLARLEPPPAGDAIAAPPSTGRDLAKTSQLPPAPPADASPLSPEVERARSRLHQLSNTSLSALTRHTPEPLPNPLAWDSMLPEVGPPARADAAPPPSSPDAELRAGRVVAEGEALRSYEPKGPIADLATLEAMRAAYEVDEALLVAARFASHAARLLPVHQHAPGVVAERLSGAVEALLLAEAYGPLAALLEHLEATSDDAGGQWVWTVVRASFVTPGQLDRLLQRLREGAPADPEGFGRCVAFFGPEVVPALLSALEQPELTQARDALLHGLAGLAAKDPAPLLARLVEPQPQQLADFVWVLERGRAPERQRAFRQLLARREPAVLREVLTGLARAATSDALQVLTQAVGDRLEEVRACAIELLGQHFPEKAFALLEPLTDPTSGDEVSAAERDAVWRALGRSTQPEAFQRLEDTLRRKPSLLNRARVEALKLGALEGLALVQADHGEALLRHVALDEDQPAAVRDVAARLLSARPQAAAAAPAAPLRIAGRRWKRLELSPRAFLIDLCSLTQAARVADVSAPQFDVAFHRLKLRLDGVLAQQRQVTVSLAGGALVFNGLEQEAAGELALVQLATGFSRYGVAGFSLDAPVPVGELRELVRWLAEGPVAAGVRTPGIQRQRAAAIAEPPAPPVTPLPSLADPTREATTRFASLVLALRDFLDVRGRAPTTPPPDVRATLDELAAVMQTRAVRFLGVAPRVTGTESVAWHHVNVTMLALGFGAELGLSLPRLQALAERVFLHDVGMYGVPEEVLLRTGQLSPADNEALLAARRRSAWFPFERLGPAQRAAAWAATAVEFGLDWGVVDKDGRARQLHDIGLVGGIVSLAKTYDALTSRRSYREAMAPAAALSAMQSRTYQRFRPDLLPLFISFVQRVTPRPPPATGR